MTIEVEAGNTLSSIAAAHGADWRKAIVVRDGLASEGIDNITDISPGDQVILTDGMVRIVAGPADTLYGIGVANNVRWQDLIVLRQAEWQRGSSSTYVIAGRVLTAQDAGNGLLTGDRIYLPHFEGCQCGDDIPDGGATSAAEAGADATGETAGVEQTTQDCDDDRTHFVIHSTSGVVSLAQLTTHERYKTTETMRDADGNPILDDNGAARTHVVSSRSKGHIYVFSNGSQHALWPITETNVWATKIESRLNPPGKGKMIHIEREYPKLCV